jgi:riboflavin biosynthesis pyrimidine reductase
MNELTDFRPLEVLFEREDLPRFELPAPLVTAYGGGLGFSRPRLFANFVASLDGVVALPEGGESGQIISGKNQADRFVMGMLRACAEAVIIGAGTFRRSTGHLWRAQTIFPGAAAAFAEARRGLGLAPEPRLVLLSGAGELDPDAPAVRDALIVTTRKSEAKLRASLPATAEVVALDSDPIAPTELVALLHQRGYRLLLTEGGPSLFAELMDAKLVDEVFLTSSPKLFGHTLGDQRKSLIFGRDLGGMPLDLVSVRRQGSHLFLRYQIENVAQD